MSVIKAKNEATALSLCVVKKVQYNRFQFY